MKTVIIALSAILGLALVWVVLPASVKLRFQEEASVQAFMDNSAAVASYEAGDLGQAMSFWTSAVSVNPSEDKLHYNLGLGFQTMSRGPEAESSYGLVLKSPSATATEKFAVEYNLGVMAQKNKQIDTALKHYQAALDLNPESLETKINIELLISQGGSGGGQGEDQNKDGDKSKDPKDQKDQKDQEKDGEDNKPKEYAQNKPQKPQFKSEDLTPSDVNKILNELKQQEQRIRADFSRKGAKETQGDKDW